MFSKIPESAVTISLKDDLCSKPGAHMLPKSPGNGITAIFVWFKNYIRNEKNMA